MTPNETAFLQMIAVSEIGTALLAVSDRGYNVIVGSTATAPLLMKSYADHPRRRVWLPALRTFSSAAGRYQVLQRIYDAYRKPLKLPDFGPASQDRLALQLIRERGALPDIDAGRFADAVGKVRTIWASLPGAGYGQHENRLEQLQAAYVAAGGVVA